MVPAHGRLKRQCIAALPQILEMAIGSFLTVLTDVQGLFDPLHVHFKHLYVFADLQIVFKVSKVLLHWGGNRIRNNPRKLLGLVIDFLTQVRFKGA